MNQSSKFTIIAFCIILCSLVLSSCSGGTSPVPSLVPMFSQTPRPTKTNALSATIVITATPTLNYKTVILTPDDLFSLPGPSAWSTPDSEDFCEHLPPAQIVANPDSLPFLSGRFVLCAWESWPWVMNTAVDLDTGSFVSRENERGDIVMQNVPQGLNRQPSYGLAAWNNAYINDAYVLETYANHSGANKLSYDYCESMLQGESNPSGIFIEEGKIACVKTTEGKITLIRVEKIYPPNTLSVEFSFAILRNE